MWLQLVKLQNNYAKTNISATFSKSPSGGGAMPRKTARSYSVIGLNASHFALTYNAFFRQKCVIGPAQEERITHKTAFFALYVSVCWTRSTEPAPSRLSPRASKPPEPQNLRAVRAPEPQGPRTPEPQSPSLKTPHPPYTASAPVRHRPGPVSTSGNSSLRAWLLRSAQSWCSSRPAPPAHGRSGPPQSSR